MESGHVDALLAIGGWTVRDVVAFELGFGDGSDGREC